MPWMPSPSKPCIEDASRVLGSRSRARRAERGAGRGSRPRSWGRRLRGAGRPAPPLARALDGDDDGRAGPGLRRRSLGKSVEAVIVDDAGTIVAQRTLTDRSARTCVPLARAVGAWASLVLDAEMVRAKDDDGSEPTPARPRARAAACELRSAASADSRLRASARDAASSPDGEPATRTPRALELGTMVYLPERA